MSTVSGVLPDFERPPVVEVFIGVQFEGSRALRPIELGALRERWLLDFPQVEEQPPLPPSLEAPDGAVPSFQVFVGPPTSRIWFLSADSSSLVQLQADRLIVNWRQAADSGPYPRWDHVRAEFLRRLTETFEFIESRDERPPTIRQVEVTYTNAIDSPAGGAARLDEALDGWRNVDQHHLGPAVESRATLVYPVKGLGEGLARLYVEAQPGQRPDGRPTTFLALTLRGAPLAGEPDAAVQFADFAHDHIVRSFAELTPTAMHSLWGRRA